MHGLSNSTTIAQRLRHRDFLAIDDTKSMVRSFCDNTQILLETDKNLSQRMLYIGRKSRPGKESQQNLLLIEYQRVKYFEECNC